MILNRNTVILTELQARPIHHAIEALRRDMQKMLLQTETRGTYIHLQKDSALQCECFALQEKKDVLWIYATDILGFVYGIYEISRRFLQVQDFWFWNDQPFPPVAGVEIPQGFSYTSSPFRVRYRGWFINDETLLMAWRVDGSRELPWQMAFEALLRCGGNLVIPGTDQNAPKYRDMASDMGLVITHHHAEPLGAEMFARAFPDLTPSYSRYPELFQSLWKEGIAQQSGKQVLWNLGFRGQGDRPFWQDDPRYDTPEARGRLISDLIRIQYDLVKGQDPNALCVTNLYGETMELYQEGHLTFPADVVKIWADNGFGKMVTRRQGNHNPRIEALPQENDHGLHGIYYHVSFYDLQAANHITMLPNSAEFVQRELRRALKRKADRYWLINCSNIKPHVYFLDYAAQLWRDGGADTRLHREKYAANYYGAANRKKIANCIEAYAKRAIAYGCHDDEHAGEQFAHHVPRMLISNYMKSGNQQAEDMLWVTNALTLTGQVRWYRTLCEQAKESYCKYLSQCEETSASLNGEAQILFEDSLLLQAKLHYHGYNGALYVCEALLCALEEKYLQSFYQAGCARREYLLADRAMRTREHGKWQDFYQNECQTDVKQSAWVCEYLMSHVRNLGDGPHFYQWQRLYQDCEADLRIMLLLNTSNHLKDLELFALMESKWDDFQIKRKEYGEGGSMRSS